jgi:hypothetical protein
MRKGIHTKTSTKHFADYGMMALDGSIGNLRRHAGHNGWSSLTTKQCGSEEHSARDADDSDLSQLFLDVRILGRICSILKGSRQ